MMKDLLFTTEYLAPHYSKNEHVTLLRVLQTERRGRQ